MSTLSLSGSTVYLEVDHGVVVVPEDELRLADVLPELAGEDDGVPRLHVLLAATQDARLHVSHCTDSGRPPSLAAVVTGR